MAFQNTESAAFWESNWEEARKASFLASSQNIAPERWLDFYNSVSGVYHEIWGDSGSPGPVVADYLHLEKLIDPYLSVLDMGCGPGTLGIPIAKKGGHVTCVDYSSDMLETLKSRARETCGNIETVCSSFESYKPERTFDLAVAACFPPVMSPSGLKGLESLSNGYCAVVMGSGRESNPLRRELWDELMEEPMPVGGFHLTCLLGYLLSSGRRPNLKHFTRSFPFKCKYNDCAHFYSRYFSIFGCEDDASISKVLKRHVKGNFVETQGDMSICLIWWKSPQSPEGN